MKATPSRDDLELQKLALEIRELQRAWWQRPVYLSILLPVVLGSLTVLAGILSGYFDRERTQLKRSIESLKRENTALLQAQSVIRQASADAEKRLRNFNEKYQLQSEQLNKILQTTTEPQVRITLEKIMDQLQSYSRNSPTPKPEQKK